SKVPSPRVDETAFLTGDVRYGEAFPTDTSLDACQDKENIAKTSAMPYEALPNVTSLGGDVQEELLSISKKDKGKGKMIEPEQPSTEKVLEQLSVQIARDLEAKFDQEDLIILEQAKRDSKIAKIHAEKELEMMIAELDRSNEMVAKYLSEYEQDEVGLSHDEKVELINELLMYQRHLAQIKKYQAQQNKPATNTERRNFYMSILRSKAAEASGTEPTQEQQSEEPKELSEEELKKMMELVPVEELYIEALQVKYFIIDWEIYSEGQRKYWKIIRVGNHTEVYQIFEDMLKKFNREDLDKLWSLVKETCSTTEVTDEKSKEL
nr:hypothetical protein [Tanacetum cinerariifolium]